MPRPIATPDRRLRVFVSSTLEELAAERVAVRAAITRLRLTPVMFELGARAAPAARALPRLPRAERRLRRHLRRALRLGRPRHAAISGLEDEFELSAGQAAAALRPAHRPRTASRGWPS